MILPKKKEDKWRTLQQALQIAYDLAPSAIDKLSDPIERARAQGKVDGLRYCLQLVDEMNHE